MICLIENHIIVRHFFIFLTYECNQNFQIFPSAVSQEALQLHGNLPLSSAAELCSNTAAQETWTVSTNYCDATLLLLCAHRIKSPLWIHRWRIHLCSYFPPKWRLSCSSPQHSTADYMHDGADPLDLFDQLATKPRGSRSDSDSGLQPHSAAFCIVWVSGHLGWLMDQWGGLIWQLASGNNGLSCFSSSRAPRLPCWLQNSRPTVLTWCIQKRGCFVKRSFPYESCDNYAILMGHLCITFADRKDDSWAISPPPPPPS